MNNVSLTRAAGMVAGLALLLVATGCCQKEKQMITDLQASLEDAGRDNDQLRSRLAEAETQVGSLQSDARLKEMTIASLQQRLNERPAQQPAQATGQWDVGQHADRVTLESDILFDSGKATLTAAGKTKLDSVVRDLKNNYAGKPVRVFGFTDTDPIRRTKNLWSDNLDLSLNRAAEVTRYLVAKGVEPKTIETVGMGEYFPLSSKAKSRRVEIVVIKD